MKQKVLTIILSLVIVFGAFAQNTVTGVVSDADSGEALIGASILISGTSKGTITDIDGKFSLNVPSDATTLTISFIGYEEQAVSVVGVSQLSVSLSPGQALEEVVVTALGIEEKKSSLSYATQRIEAKGLNASRIGDVSQQLSGKIPGLSINTGNGSGVSSSRIILRGESSLNFDKNQPLIIVDGVVVSNNLDGIQGTANGSWSNLPVDYGNGLTDFNTDDIEDVTVLKGPKAAALYGARASNGALVIRTKSGIKKEGIGVALNFGFAVDKVTRFWDEQTQYGGGFDNVFRANWGGNYGAPTDGALISQTTGREAGLGITPDPTPNLYRLDRKGFFDTGVSFNNNLALSFGNDNTWGRISIAKLTKTGIVPNTEYDRDNVGLRLGTELTDKLTLDISANYVVSQSGNLPVIGTGGEGLINNMYWAMGNYSYDDFRDYWLPGQEGVQQNHFLTWGTNPYLIVNENLNAFKRNRLFGNIKLNYEINDDLSLFVRAGTDYYNDSRNSRRPSGQPNFPNGMYREQDIGYNETNIDMLLTYRKSLSEKIGLEVSAGGNNLNITSNTKFFETRSLGVLGVYNQGNAGDTPFTSNFNAEKRINSLYGTAKFNYDESIYLDVTARNDWSSALPSDNNSFFYPSVGVSAVLSNLMELPDVISFAQVRASWAEVGNDTDPFLTQRTLSFGTLPSSVINPSLLPNTNLKPEETSAFEIGTEIKLLSNRVGIDFNYYKNISRNQILQTPISQASGAVSSLINAGEIENQGLELFLKATPITTSQFTWNVSVAWSRNRGKVVKLTEGVETFIIAQGATGGTVEAKPGGRMGDIYGRGFARSPEGDIILDVVNTGSRDVVRPRLETDIQNLGNYNPDWTAGVTNTIRYKNFDLGVFFDYRKGGIIVSNTSALLYRSGIITESLPHRTEDFVPEGVIENSDGTFSANTTGTTGQDWYRANFQTANIEANTYDATFFKLREISIGIDLKPWLKNLPLEKVHLSFFGRNLWIKTKDRFLRHFDPEALSQSGGTIVPGFEVGQLPNPITLGANLKVQF
ncbi:MAG: SusC/RagA family TonB-linked outer membrane protein [Reichenbachiella sp.]|uniref:SusC/RagA family TonB-linked outer membrane protein n=3 Tax=Reichenbachiella sp. TaxID=2184521 RepID=UPI003264E670